MSGRNLPPGVTGGEEYFEDGVLVAGDDGEVLQEDDVDDLDRAIEALECVRWSDVETVSAATAAQFCQQLREARDRRQGGDRR